MNSDEERYTRLTLGKDFLTGLSLRRLQCRDQLINAGHFDEHDGDVVLL